VAAAAHFWSDTVPEGPGGLAGSRWILEGPYRPGCSRLSLEPAGSRSRRGHPPRGHLYPGSRAHPARRTRLGAPSNNRMQLTGPGRRFVEGLAPPAGLRHVLAI